jgi:hypothetical protein
MSSSRFLQEARKIIRQHPGVFDALMEYEKTRKLPKTIYRERINLTIDENILKKFKEYCRGKNINMSKLIESHIKEELKIK